MKKWLIEIFICTAFLLGLSFSATAQLYVKVRPHAPVITRPHQPSGVHIWINEEWIPDHDHYRYSGGRWDRPPHADYIWRNGHWHHHHRGEVWIPGGWIKRR